MVKQLGPICFSEPRKRGMSLGLQKESILYGDDKCLLGHVETMECREDCGLQALPSPPSTGSCILCGYLW